MERRQIKLLRANPVHLFAGTLADNAHDRDAKGRTRNGRVSRPGASNPAAKLSELAATGLQDAYVVKSGALRNAISLGLYANDEAARQRVREVEDKGVLGTRVELLPRQGTDFYFVIRSEDPDALKSLGGIKQAYPNSQQSRVACPSL